MLVNGHAIGVAVTMLGLADFAFAVDGANFSTPFAQLGLAPEACSSITFPTWERNLEFNHEITFPCFRIMGHAKAMELFCLDRALSADEAESLGLVNRVFPREHFQQRIEEELGQLADLSLNVRFQNLKKFKRLFILF